MPKWPKTRFFGHTKAFDNVTEAQPSKKRSDRPFGVMIGLLVWVPLLACGAPDGDSPGAGPILDRFDLTLTLGRRTEAIGPLFYDEIRESQKTWAIPPLFSSTTDPAVELKEVDFLYPVMTYDRYGDQFRWQFFQVLSFAGGPTQTEQVRHRFTIFPLYFQQRSSDPGQDYTAFVPFYGHLRHRLFRDDIFFVMFPIYGRTVKKGDVTRNYVYPFFHVREGPGLHGWQFWPLLGREHKDVTTTTNGFNDLVTVPGHDSFFALWPIYFKDQKGIGSDNPSREIAVLPAFAMQRSPQRDATTVIWPFFSRIDDRGKKYREWDMPWPLVVKARGEGKYTTRVWPFFSWAHSPTLESDFYLWPIYKYNRARLAPLDRQRTRILFFLYSDTVEKNTETDASRRRTYLWPLFTARTDFNGNRRLQVLAPLEPFVEGSHKIPRDYSPLWSVWRSEHNPGTGASSQSLLWNLYRRDAAPGKKRVSAAFGLFQYQAGSGGKRVRVFYIPFGKEVTRRSASAAGTPEKPGAS